MAFKSKANKMFEAKMKLAVDARNFDEVAHLFHLYGCYLELVEPIPETSTSKELVHVDPLEPSVHAEQMFVLSGEYERSRAEMQQYLRPV